MARTHPQPPTSQQHVLVNDEPHLGVSWQPLGSEADAPVLEPRSAYPRLCTIHVSGKLRNQGRVPKLADRGSHHVSLVDFMPKAQENENCRPRICHLACT